MGKIISVLNQKGGVGKTTTTINLGGALLEKGYKVLLIDSDGQASLTEALGFSADLPNTLYGAMKKEYSLPIYQHTDGFHIVPSCIDLSAIEMELISEIGRERVLTDLIRPYKEQYDYIIIDCPPSLSILSMNALTASDYLIIPVQPHYLALRGMKKLLENVSKIQARLNPDLKIAGALITKHDPRKNLYKGVEEVIREEFPGKVFDTQIREIVALAESPTEGKDIFHYAPKSPGATEYMNFCNEFLSTIQNGKI